MSLILVYALFILVGDAVAIGIAEVVELYSVEWSLGVFLALYFVVFWIGWHIAVRVTEPKLVPAKIPTPMAK